MYPLLRPILWSMLAVLAFAGGNSPCRGQIRDGGIDPWNLGQGDWIYSISDATNKLGGHVGGVTNENSLMLFYRSVGIRYMIVKAATSDQLFRGCYSFPQFTSYLVNVAHTNGILIFGYNRSYGSNVVGEIAISDFVFQQGADGFVYDAEAEWESSASWIGATGPAKAWQLCSAVRSNWPTKFLAHAPFPIISFHTSFPYKEFGYWCDSIMPQIYHFSSSGLKGSPSACINWSDVNWFNWQESLYRLPPTNINGLTVYWTNAIKPLAPIHDVYGERGRSPCEGTTGPVPDRHVMEFIDYLNADPNPQTVGGYRGVSFWRADLHGTNQWSHIRNATIGEFPEVVNNIVLDDPSAVTVGPWTSTRTFYNANYYGNGTDTNSFGTNYLSKGQGAGTAYVQFNPQIVVAGEYDVYQWHPFISAASASTPFIITHSAGSTTVYANQQTNSGGWSGLGRFNFAPGTAQIRVSDGNPDPGKVVIADGLKLVPVPPTAPPALSPSDLKATALSGTQIDLSWNDRSTNESGFVVCRSLNPFGPFTNAGWARANLTNYSDSGLLPTTAYYYVVRAVNAAGSSTNSNPASATTLTAPPVITVPPQRRTVLPNQAVSFTVAATGQPPLGYQWRLNGNPIPGATGTAYALTQAAVTDSGVYSVLVTNPGGATLSSGALLTLIGAAAWGDASLDQTNIPDAATNLVAVAAGDWHNLALHTDGSVVAWGNNWDGQCDVPAELNDALAIVAGGYHSLAIRADRSIRAWGAGVYGQTTVPLSATNVIAIAAGSWHSLALRADGAVVAWGDNSSGQTSLPLNLSNVIAVAAGGNHSLALRKDGQVIAWGDNLGEDGSFAGQSTVPYGLSNVVAIAAGEYHSLAIKGDGTVTAWGDDDHGQCGVPMGLSNVVAVVGGAGHSLALKEDGSLAAWGANDAGQCTLPAGIIGASGVGAGAYHSIVFVNDGTFRPRLFSPGRISNRFEALLQTLLRKRYAVEFRSSPVGSSWTPFATNTGNGALLLLLDQSASVSQRFYRARQL